MFCMILFLQKSFHMRKLVVLLFFQALIVGSVANNVQLGTPVLNASNELVFTISWDNSWHTSSAPHNWDGVYLFVKYRNCASTNAWSHAQLNTTASTHSVQSPLLIDPYKLSDGKGLIVRRSAPGSGSISNDTVKLKLVSPGLGSSYDFQVFAIEMVMIPRGSFYLGDGFSTYTITNGNSSSPYYVSSDAAISKSITSGNIYCTTSTSSIYSNIPLAFPVGYDSMYVMKYEISQGQYAAFLNTLSSDQAANRAYIVNANRINLAGTWPNYSTTFPHRAMGYLSWQDLSAYLDWAALRPMTETEFEKICRGPNYPVAGEYAWGSNTINDCNTISSDGTATEKNTALPAAGFGIANYNSDFIAGPMRCGFAAGLATDRLQAGSSYYGVMEMSGNIGELCIGLYDNTGLAFTPTNGDGNLTGSPTPGFANTSSWPNLNSGTTGIALRGGGYSETYGYLRVSDRYIYHDTSSSGRNANRGGRGIR